MRLLAGVVVASVLSLTGFALADDDTATAVAPAVSELGKPGEVSVASADDAGEDADGKSVEEKADDKSEPDSDAKPERKAKKSARSCSGRKATGSRLGKRC